MTDETLRNSEGVEFRRNSEGSGTNNTVPADTIPASARSISLAQTGTECPTRNAKTTQPPPAEIMQNVGQKRPTRGKPRQIPHLPQRQRDTGETVRRIDDDRPASAFCIPFFVF